MAHVRSAISGQKGRVLHREKGRVLVELADGKREIWTWDNVTPADHAEKALELARELSAEDLVELAKRVHIE